MNSNWSVACKLIDNCGVYDYSRKNTEIGNKITRNKWERGSGAGDTTK